MKCLLALKSCLVIALVFNLLQSIGPVWGQDEEGEEDVEVELDPEAKKLLDKTKIAWDDGPVKESIEKGIKFLLSQQNENVSFGTEETQNGHCTEVKQDSPKFRNAKLRAKIGELNWEPEQRPTAIGITSVAVYALMKSGVSIRDKQVQKALEYLTTHDSYSIYSIGLRCNTHAFPVHQIHLFDPRKPRRQTRTLHDNQRSQAPGYTYRQ